MELDGFRELKEKCTWFEKDLLACGRTKEAEREALQLTGMHLKRLEMEDPDKWSALVALVAHVTETEGSPLHQEFVPSPTIIGRLEWKMGLLNLIPIHSSCSSLLQCPILSDAPCTPFHWLWRV